MYLWLLYHNSVYKPSLIYQHPKRGKKGATNYKILSPSSSSKTFCTHTARPNKSGFFAVPAREAAEAIPGDGCQATGKSARHPRHVIGCPFIGAARKRQTFQICTAARHPS